MVFIILLLIAYFSNKNDKPEKPDWHNYTSFTWENFRGKWLFTWSYNGNSIDNLRPICSKCKCELSNGTGDNRYELYCPSCSARFPCLDTNTRDDVKKIIIRDLNTGDWEKRVGNNVGGTV